MQWKDLKVWEKSHNAVLKIYKLTSTFPNEERFALTSQLRRSSYSIPSNIVEGESRHTTKEYLSFLYNARGSVEETRYFLILAKDLKYIGNERYILIEKDYEVISKMLNGLIKVLKTQSIRNP